MTYSEADRLAHELAKADDWLRRYFFARLSCAMVQHGSHIDSLPTNEQPTPTVALLPDKRGAGELS